MCPRLQRQHIRSAAPIYKRTHTYIRKHILYRVHILFNAIICTALHRNKLDAGGIAPTIGHCLLQKFSTFSALVHLLCKGTIERTFANECPLGASLIFPHSCCRAGSLLLGAPLSAGAEVSSSPRACSSRAYFPTATRYNPRQSPFRVSPAAYKSAGECQGDDVLAGALFLSL